MNNYLEDLSKEELMVLLKKNKGDRDRTHTLERVYKGRYKVPAKLNNLCIDTLNRLGYTNNTLYKEESLNIISKFPTEIKSINVGNISYECISIVIVTEILDFYQAKYDENEMINFYELDKNEYINTKRILNNILVGLYWLH
jgi:hypothetical protein